MTAKRPSLVHQLAGDRRSDPPVPAQDVVVAQLPDRLRHVPDPAPSARRLGDQVLRHEADGPEDQHDARARHDHRPDAARRVKLADLLERRRS